MPSDPLLFTAFPHEDYLAHRPAIDAALQKMLSQGHYILGEEVMAFEQEFAVFTGTRHAIGVANGTDAIEVILRALDIGRGASVVVPSHTAVASASGISRAGATPVFVDVDAVTFTICPDSLAGLLKSDEGRGVKAVLAVHLYGHPVAWEQLQRVTTEHGVVLIEDCAQAHGAVYQGKKAGALGRAAAFSFYPTKNLGAIGDGGVVTTDDDSLAERIRVIRQYGWRQRYMSDCEGVNSRLDEMQAAILRVKLPQLSSRVAERRRLAALYTEGLREMPNVCSPAVKSDCEHAYHLYVIRSKQRDALMQHLLSAGVPVALHYPAAIHQQRAYATTRHGGLKHTEALIPEILSLPLHPFLSDEAVQFTLEAMRNFTAS